MALNDKLKATNLFLTGMAGSAHSEIAQYIYEDKNLISLIQSYQHDITLPFGIYFVSRLYPKDAQSSRYVNALTVFGICAAGEIAQGLGLYRGTFDPKDFIAYGIGAGLAMFVDKLAFKDKKQTANPTH